MPHTQPAPDEFTPDERRALEPYFTNLDGPVFALVEPARDREGRALRTLLAVGQVAAPALPRRVLDGGSQPGGQPADGRGGHRARRTALRARVLGVRRRLGGPARRRAPGLRAGVERADEGARVGPADGLPRAVHALRALHGPAGRALEVPGAARARARRAARPLRRDARPRVRGLRALDRADAGALPPALPEHGGRLGGRVPRGHPREGARHLARPAAGGHAVERRHLRHGPGLRGAAAAHARAPARRGRAITRT